jgi:Tetratricopeptide repeat
MVQMNLGIVLQRLGEREGGTARLEEAVAAYRLALEERTRERVPLHWATTQYNLANALQTLGEREGWFGAAGGGGGGLRRLSDGRRVCLAGRVVSRCAAGTATTHRRRLRAAASKHRFARHAV